MPTARTIQTDFKSGEIDQLLKMRSNTNAYASGCERLRNCIIYTSGAVSRRPGTRYIKAFTAFDAGTAMRLLPFEFSATERYLVAMFANRLEFFRVNADGTASDLLQTISGAASCPWGADILSEVTFTQVADTMILCHRSFQPRVLKRLSLTTFAISLFDFTSTYDNTVKNQPYYKFDETIRLKVSGTDTGTSVTMTASAPFFTAQHVGTIFRIYGCEVMVTAFTNSTTVQAFIRAEVRRKLDPNPIKIARGSNVYEFLAIDHGLATGAILEISGCNTFLGYPNDTATLGSVLNGGNINGSETITVLDQDRFTTSNDASATASQDGGGSNVSYTTTDFTSSWDEQAFSPMRGWPGAVCFHENRLWFAGTSSIPDGVFASKSGLYYDFNVDEGNDADSIQFTVGSSKISTIRHIVSNRVLQLFSDLGEYAVNFGVSGPITPANVVVRQQTPYGCGSVPPAPFDGSTIFVQSNSQTVREFVYVNTEDGFVATDLTAASSHLVETPIDMAVITGTKGRTEQYAFLVNNDGTIAVFHSSKAEGLAAWTLWSTASGHAFKSVCAVGNRVFALVRRQHHTSSVNSTPAWTTVLEEFIFDDNSVTLDCTRTLTASPASASWSNSLLAGSLPIYNGNALSLTSGNVHFGNLEGSSLATAGNTTISSARSSLNIGFGFSIEIRTLPPEFELQDGPITGAKRRINRVIIGIDSTLSMTVDGQAFIARQLTDDLAQDPQPQTNKQQFYMLGYSRDPYVQIMQDAPLPIRITGLVTEVSV